MAPASEGKSTSRHEAPVLEFKHENVSAGRRTDEDRRQHGCRSEAARDSKALGGRDPPPLSPARSRDHRAKSPSRSPSCVRASDMRKHVVIAVTAWKVPDRLLRRRFPSP